jgi:hypothetical protein
MVGTPEPSAPAPPGGPPSMFSRWWWALPNLQLRHRPGARRRRFHIDGGRSRTFSSGTSQGPAVDVFTLMVGASGPSAPAPPGGLPSMFSHWWWVLPDLQLQHLSGARRQRFHVGGGRSRTFQLRHLLGVRCRCFHVDGGCSRIFSSGTSRGPAVDVFTLMVGASLTVE